MTRTDLIPALAFGTIGIVLLIAVFLLVRFMRKPANRNSMDGEPERNIAQIREESGIETVPDRAIK